ncbi:MAG: peptidoglycan-associated lipoprotein Pal [Acidobacteriota bacterium]
MTGRAKWMALVLILFIIASAMLLVSCPRKAKKEPAQPATEIPPFTPAQEKIEKTPAPVEVKESWLEPATKEEDLPEVAFIDELNMKKLLKTVYFDFDKYDLREDTIATLKENTKWLRENPQYQITLEGHCDERGTIEYNLELGAKRAGAVKNYLISLGLSEERFKSISYGEERPADPDHNEEAWAKNRRVEFIIGQ